MIQDSEVFQKFRVYYVASFLYREQIGVSEATEEHR